MAKSRTAKKPTAETPAEVSGATSESVVKPAVDDMPEAVKAIAAGKALIAEGKSKADAAREMFSAIGELPKEIVVATFIEGAGLTPKGAMTYWYNCRRKISKKPD